MTWDQLQEYDVIVYMDADILILGNIVSILESIPPLGRRLGAAGRHWRDHEKPLDPNENCEFNLRFN